MQAGCPKAVRHGGSSRGRAWLRWMFPVVGALSLLWFLIRVIPKPSRAAYPCQRTAAPLAGGFLLWVAGAPGSLSLFRRARRHWQRSQVVLAASCLIVAAVLGVSALQTVSDRPAMAKAPEANQPIGQAKGVNPGRVVWAHDGRATNWDGPGDGHWWEKGHTNQAVVDRMMSDAIQNLTGKTSDREAWDALFRYFNQAHGNGDTGYSKGEKITIKVNLVGCIIGRNVDPVTYDMLRRPDYMNTSPQMMLALLRQLVRQAGVDQQDITIGDPLALFPNQYYDLLHGEFPNVHYLDHDGGNAAHPRRGVRVLEFTANGEEAGLRAGFLCGSEVPHQPGEPEESRERRHYGLRQEPLRLADSQTARQRLFRPAWEFTEGNSGFRALPGAGGFDGARAHRRKDPAVLD